MRKLLKIFMTEENILLHKKTNASIPRIFVYVILIALKLMIKQNCQKQLNFDC